MFGIDRRRLRRFREVVHPKATTTTTTNGPFKRPPRKLSILEPGYVQVDVPWFVTNEEVMEGINCFCDRGFLHSNRIPSPLSRITRDFLTG